MTDEPEGPCIRIRVLNRQNQLIGGTVDIDFKQQATGNLLKVKAADASKNIDVSGLQRTPQGLYQVTVTPTDVFRPDSKFVNIPASGFASIDFTIDKDAGNVPEGTLLDRVLRELGNTKMNRRDVAGGLIAELQSRQSVTPAEAGNLTACLEVILAAGVIDAGVIDKIAKLAELFHDPGSVAGTIANTTVSVARAIQATQANPPARE